MHSSESYYVILKNLFIIVQPLEQIYHKWNKYINASVVPFWD